MPEGSMFHFAEPAWLLALLAILPAGIWLFASTRFSSPRRFLAYADRHLLPHLTDSRELGGRERWRRFGLWALTWAILVVAMAGPRWDYRDMGLFLPGTDLVILLDISRSMQVSDVAPNRLARARQEIEDLLDQNPGIRTGLIAFASVAHVVAPVTEDNESIRRILPALSTDLVRLQGSRLDEGLARARQLLKGQPDDSSHAILLISDGDFVEPGLEQQVAELARDGIRLHVLGIGTPAGGPVPRPDGQPLRDRQGMSVISRLGADQLQRLASAGQGLYRQADFRDSDTGDIIEQVLKQTRPQAVGAATAARVWNEQFYWLVIVAMLLLLPALRRMALPKRTRGGRQ
jgi:Ca-activated chloride channel family protein